MNPFNIKPRLLFVAILLLLPLAIHAQKRTSAGQVRSFAMLPDLWNYQKDKVEFVRHKNVQSLKVVQNDGIAVLKDLKFLNGTVEFDAEPLDAAAAPFVTCYFRFQDKNETEVFYLRVGRQPSLSRNDAVQYAPVVKGVNLWDMLPHFQAPAPLYDGEWNHIKLVISGLQLRAYVNDMTRPVLEVPFLEGPSKAGTIAFEGFAAFANLVIKPDAVEGLSPSKGVDLTDHDANYLRTWLVSQPIPFEEGREISLKDLPTNYTSWDSLRAERNALINVTRNFGGSDRRYVWLATTITSTADLQRKIDLGFSDEVWVFVNRQLVYVDKNLYLQGMRKNPNGRCSIQNSSFNFKLKPGENEILIGLANNFYGWGIIARLDNLEGIELSR
jgi:hypothetical protein